MINLLKRDKLIRKILGECARVIFVTRFITAILTYKLPSYVQCINNYHIEQMDNMLVHVLYLCVMSTDPITGLGAVRVVVLFTIPSLHCGTWIYSTCT